MAIRATSYSTNYTLTKSEKSSNNILKVFKIVKSPSKKSNAKLINQFPAGTAYIFSKKAYDEIDEDIFAKKVIDKYGETLKLLSKE